MYAIVKTGGKQYRITPGEVLNVEKLPGEVGDKVSLDAICVVDGKKVEADPSKASSTKVEAVIVEQFKDKKILVFKFKKRKNYKRLQGHRQNMTRIQIVQIGTEKAEATALKKKSEADEAAEKPATKKTAAKADKKVADKKEPAKKAAPKKKSEPKEAKDKDAESKKQAKAAEDTASDDKKDEE